MRTLLKILPTLFLVDLLIILLISCSEPSIHAVKSEKDILFENRKGRRIIEWERLDTINFRSDSLIHYSFQMKTEGNAFTHRYEFPWGSSTKHIYTTDRNSRDSIQMVLLDSLNIRMNGGQFLVKKYLCDLLSSIDDETVLYFNPHFGILILESVSWNNDIRLINNEFNEAPIIYGIQEIISQYFQKGIGILPPPPPPEK